ncbi:acyl-CoA reductase [Mesonia sp. K7]|uniref:acyl-CoA reductase n=1 Tax=Mesonia sp. K7 TaxID=2218606 RepID=UPI000DA7F4FB|nr:acyl-CoA reductase [Mesonia sp. K7]PZD79285.1 acyl-CoA reductase [Mesonia sp. K7]
MTVKERIIAFSKLGDFLTAFLNKNTSYAYAEFFPELSQKIETHHLQNGWFTPENISFSIQQWANALTEENLTHWLSNYSISEKLSSKKVAIIMAGNIPLVGFHDLLSVLISGHQTLIKQSSNAQILLPFLIKVLQTIEPRFKNRITFTKEKLEDFDVVIATGSDNTARYFEYYFSKKPNIIRKNRNSVAIISENDSTEDLEKLSDDIFRYFGLGCRNVSKIYLPKGYDIQKIFQALYNWKEVINHHKYANNYDYNKAVYLMSKFQILDNDFIVLKEDENFASPIASLFYEYYDNQKELNEKLDLQQEKIQCIVSNLDTNHIKFGETQQPKLNDYADGVDTVNFLTQL